MVVTVVMVMVAVVGGPPEGAALNGRASEKPHAELGEPSGLEAAVREVAVVAAGNREHAREVPGHRKDQGRLGQGHEEGTDTHTDVRQDVGDGCDPRDALIGAANQFRRHHLHRVAAERPSFSSRFCHVGCSNCEGR